MLHFSAIPPLTNVTEDLMNSPTSNTPASNIPTPNITATTLRDEGRNQQGVKKTPNVNNGNFKENRIFTITMVSIVSVVMAFFVLILVQRCRTPKLWYHPSKYCKSIRLTNVKVKPYWFRISYDFQTVQNHLHMSIFPILRRLNLTNKKWWNSVNGCANMAIMCKWTSC